MPGNFPIRSSACALALLYLAGDLWIWNGPVSHMLGRLSVKGGGEMVARVDDMPITRSQLERATERELWFSGHPEGTVSTEDRAAASTRALRDLIDGELLHSMVADSPADIPVPASDIDAEMSRFAARFTDQAELDAAMHGQGIAGVAELRERLAERLRQERFIDARLASDVAVTSAEARAWYDSHRAELAVPERVRVRHIFVATLEKDPDDAKHILEGALADLSSGKRTFGELAVALSEDERSKTQGGDLGWIERTRMPADFSAAIFALPLGKPALIRTHIGWHLAEITARAAAADRPFDQARAEIVAALTSLKRREAAGKYRAELRRQAASRIQPKSEAITTDFTD